MPLLLTLLLLPLASCQLAEVLRHGSIFGWLRGVATQAEEAGPATKILLLPLRSMNCGFCFSHWAAAFCVGLVFCGEPGFWVLAWLAVVRASNLINDLSKPWSRTPRTRSPEDIMREVSTEHLEEEFIRRTARPFGVPAEPVPAPGQQGSPGASPPA